MRFLVMVRATATSEAGIIPDDPKIFEDMGRFNEELVNAGIMQAGEGLQPSSKGARIRFSKDDKRTVIDGPFPETKELIAGFWLWKCKSREEAVAWAKRCPSPFPGEECEIEIRPLYEFEDFSEKAFTPELREREAQLREKMASQ
ncbi:MAG TPA: YciI family protein [Usitatibacter sp.]|nr:YciI family protein [Usitatibacter sp.]